MGKFKVGDRVQVVDDRGGAKLGETGEIIGTDTTFSTAFYYIKWDAGSRKQGLYENRLALLPIAGATGKPAFKVGDRVRVIAKTGARMPDIGVVGVICDCDDGYTVAVEGVGAFGYDAHDLELVPMLLEHGRYYRSRNGRKIGPVYVVNSQAGGCIADDGDECHPYRRDGTIMYSDSEHLDLISEWIDEPVKADAPVEACEIIRLTVTADTTDLDARLDGIIQKLERIDELSSKLGLAA